MSNRKNHRRAEAQRTAASSPFPYRPVCPACGVDHAEVPRQDQGEAAVSDQYNARNLGIAAAAIPSSGKARYEWFSCT